MKTVCIMYTTFVPIVGFAIVLVDMWEWLDFASVLISTEKNFHHLPPR